MPQSTVLIMMMVQACMAVAYFLCVQDNVGQGSDDVLSRAGERWRIMCACGQGREYRLLSLIGVACFPGKCALCCLATPFSTSLDILSMCVAMVLV